MKPGKLLSLGLLSAMLAACNSGTDTAKRDAAREKAIPVVNVLTKAAASQVGLEMSRAGDEDFNPFDEKLVEAFKEAGICEGFLLLAQEIFESTEADPKFDLSTSPRFTAVVECIAGEVQSWGPTTKPSEASIMNLIDNCLCGSGGGTVFGALGYAWTGKYKSPQLSVYKAPGVGGYKAPGLGGYKAPSVPGYKSPAL